MPDLVIGRIVWYNDGSSHPCPAIVTHVWNDGMVNVTVFDPNERPYTRTSVRHGADRGEWRWPNEVFAEKVDVDLLDEAGSVPVHIPEPE